MFHNSCKPCDTQTSRGALTSREGVGVALRVVRQLEGGELPLEKALEQFEEGVRLARRGSALLDAVEQRVEVLLADSDDVAPFSEHAGDAQ